MSEAKVISIGMMRRLFALLLPHWRAYGTVCLLGLIIAGLEMIPPQLVGRAIDRMAGDNFAMRPILTMAVLWAGIAVIVQIFHGVQIRVAHTHGERILAELRQRIFEHLQKLSMGFYDRTHPGRILTMTGSDVESIRNVLIWGLNTFFANGALMLFAAVMIYHTDPALFFATVWLAPAMTALNFIYGKKVTRAWQMVRHHSSLVGANQAENIAGVRVVVAFNRQEKNLGHFNDLQDLNTLNNVMASRKSGLFQPILQWVRFFGLALILLYGSYRLMEGALRPGRLVAVILYWDWFMTPAVNFGAFFNELLIAMSGAERVFSLLDEPVEIEDPPGAKELPRLDGHVRFKNVGFSYRDATTQDGADRQRTGKPAMRKVLDNVNLDVPAGSVVALVGETGSGKSTIMSLLARFYQPSDGQILLDGYDLRECKGASLHRQMAMVSQVNFLFSGTVIENLRYARPQATDEEIFAAARRLGCHDRFLAMKDGYDTRVGEKGQALSLGERQLVCFTRALVADPRLLLLDEATSALDPLTGVQVQKALERLARGRTTFIVTHRLSTIRNADLIVVVDNGRVIEQGGHDALLARNGKYAELYRSSSAASQSRSRVRKIESSSRIETV